MKAHGFTTYTKIEVASALAPHLTSAFVCNEFSLHANLLITYTMTYAETALD